MSLRKRTNIAEYSCLHIATTFNKWLNLVVYDDCIELLYNSCLLVNKHRASIVDYVVLRNQVHIIIYCPEENKFFIISGALKTLLQLGV